MTHTISKQEEMIFSLDDVQSVAKKLASLRTECAIFTFTGLLGAGKTTLVKALLKECGVRDVVTSPTFTYMNVYTNDAHETFYHFDLYRIASLDDFLHAGFADYLYQPRSWCFIEWPEPVMPLLEKKVCHIYIDYAEEELRHIRIKIV